MAIPTVEAATTALITGEELLAMGDIARCDLVEGRIIVLSPTGRPHGKIEGRFYKAIDGFVLPRRLGEVLVGEVGIYTHRNPDSVRAADVLFISAERASRLSSSAFLDVAPDLVVEVLSPDDRWTDVVQKLREYFDIGVRLVWVADLATRSVYAYRSITDLREFAEKDTLPGDEVLPSFGVAVAELFQD